MPRRHLALLLPLALALSAGCLRPPKDKTPQPSMEDLTEFGPALLRSPNALHVARPSFIVGGVQQHTFRELGDAFQPDYHTRGHRLAFAATFHSERPDLYIADLHSRKLVRKTNDPRHSYAFPAFNARGDLIAFASDRSGNWDLYIMSADRNTAPVQVTSSTMDEIHPTWFERYDPTGNVLERKMAYCAHNDLSDEWEIWVLDLLTMTPTFITRGMYPEWEPSGQSTDPIGGRGRRLAFQRARERGDPWFSIWTVDTETYEEVEIVSGGTWAAITPTWSPDGRYIAYATVHQSPAARGEDRVWKADDIWLVDTEGNLTVQLTSDDDPDSDPVWADDWWIYFLKERNGTKNVYSIYPEILRHIEPER